MKRLPIDVRHFFLLFLFLTLASRNAAATEVSAAAVGGFAGVDPIWSFGARAGVTIAERAYVGGTFMYNPKGLVEESTRARWFTGVEGGLETVTFPVTRPYIGLGYGHQNSEFGYYDANYNPVMKTLPARGSFVSWPGIAFLFPIEPAFVGVDLRVLIWTRPDRDGSSDYLFIPCVFLTAGAKY